MHLYMLGPKQLESSFAESGLCFLVPSTRTRSNRHKVKLGRFPLNIRKYFFAVGVTKHWHKFPVEVVESPSLEIFKSCLDMVLGSLL